MLFFNTKPTEKLTLAQKLLFPLTVITIGLGTGNYLFQEYWQNNLTNSNHLHEPHLAYPRHNPFKTLSTLFYTGFGITLLVFLTEKGSNMKIDILQSLINKLN
jgi:hypothetical protein